MVNRSRTQCLQQKKKRKFINKGNRSETESEIVAAQDQALQSKYYATETGSKCRLCQQFDETIDHIMSAWPILEKERYIKRHDSVCAQLHFNIRTIGHKTLV